MGQEVYRLGELFCGPGGLACGALRSTSNDGKLSLSHAWANDYDSDTCETYRKTSALTNQKLFTVVMFVNLRLISLEILTHFVMAFRATAFLM